MLLRGMSINWVIKSKSEDSNSCWILLTDAHISCRIKTTDAAKLQDEYSKLVEGLQENTDDGDDSFMSNPREYTQCSRNCLTNKPYPLISTARRPPE